MTEPKSCPHCGENLVGEEIDPAHREAFGGKANFTRLIGISDGDSIQWYECPKCRGRVEREPPTPGAYRDSNIVIR